MNLLNFSYRDYNWFWVPIVGPHIGAICGAFIYLLMVGIHNTDEEDEDEYGVDVKNGDIGKMKSWICAQ